MRRRVLFLSTVGTSILTNISRAVKGGQIVGVSDELKSFVEKGPERAKIDDPVQEECLEIAKTQSSIFTEILNAVRSSPERMSAELNTLSRFIERNTTLIESVKVVLLPTDTGCCILCARIIEEYLRENRSKYKVEDCIVKEVKGFGSEASWYYGEGLGNLMNVIAEIVKEGREKGYYIVLSGTAGFKPESYIVGLMASLLRVHKLVYLHESFNELVELPVMPIKLDDEFLKVLSQIERGISPREIDRDLLDDLIVRGLVEVENGEIRVKDWVKIVVETLRH